MTSFIFSIMQNSRSKDSYETGFKCVDWIRDISISFRFGTNLVFECVWWPKRYMYYVCI